MALKERHVTIYCSGTTPGKWQTVDEQGAATMPIAFWTKPHEGLPKARLVLTDMEISRRLGISEEAARALIKAASGALSVTKRTKDTTRA